MALSDWSPVPTVQLHALGIKASIQEVSVSQPQHPQLYVISHTQGDITRFVWVAFQIFGLITALTFVLVTQYTAWQA